MMSTPTKLPHNVCCFMNPKFLIQAPSKPSYCSSLTLAWNSTAWQTKTMTSSSPTLHPIVLRSWRKTSNAKFYSAVVSSSLILKYNFTNLGWPIKNPRNSQEMCKVSQHLRESIHHQLELILPDFGFLSFLHQTETNHRGQRRRHLSNPISSGIQASWEPGGRREQNRIGSIQAKVGVDIRKIQMILLVMR